MKEQLKRGVDYIAVGVVFFCHDGSGNFVMAKRSQQAKDEQGRWDLGGGGVELHEKLEETLVREVLEEYGSPVLKLEFLGFRDVHRINNGQKTHWIAFDFKVLVDRDKVKICEPHKFTDLKWFTLDALPPESEQHSQLPAFLKNYRKKLL